MNHHPGHELHWRTITIVVLALTPALVGSGCSRRIDNTAGCVSDPTTESVYTRVHPLHGIGTTGDARAMIDRGRKFLTDDPLAREVLRERAARMANAKEAIFLDMAHTESGTREHIWIISYDKSTSVLWMKRGVSRVWRLDEPQWSALRRQVGESDPSSLRSFADLAVADGLVYFVQLCLDDSAARFAYYGSVPQWPERWVSGPVPGAAGQRERAIIQSIADVLRWAPA